MRPHHPTAPSVIPIRLSGDLNRFMQNMDKLPPDTIPMMGRNGARYLADNYTVAHVADIIQANL